MLFSVGYAGRSVDELLDRLHEQDVRVVVDVRLNPSSRQPGFSRKSLAAALESAGIAYVHEPTLGNPRDNRAAFARDDPSAWQRLRERFATEGADALDRIVDRGRLEHVAVMCLERDPAHCHRHLVLEMALERAPDLEVTDIP